ncbi:MAG: outer membrane lipoprotein-sorting protein [Myxococcota bacterium]|jgi:outer membrane lipoprotein-sorting protein
MRTRDLLCLLIAAPVLLLSASAASAADAYDTVQAAGPQAVLEATDKRMVQANTQQWRFKMTVAPKTGDPKHMEFVVWQKDRTKRLVRFVAPGPVKGLSMLTRGKGIMYVYSPETDNVRRIATHAKRQSLLGSNLYFSDMSAADMSEEYTAVFAEDAADHRWLTLTKKADSDAAWDALRARVDKSKLLVDTIEYLDGKKVVRIQRRTQFETLGGHPTYRVVSMETVGDGLVTTLEMQEQHVGPELEDGMFKKRNLVRGQ